MIPAGSQQMFESGKNTIFVPLPCPAVSGAMLTLTLKDLFISPGVLEDEEEGEGEHIDAYSIVYVYTDDLSVLQVSWFGEGGDAKDPGCPSPDAQIDGDPLANGGRCPLYVPFVIFMDQTPICQSASISGCEGSFGIPNNQSLITLVEGQELKVHMIVMDDDINSADDLICEGETVLPAWHDNYWLGDIQNSLTIDVGPCLFEFFLSEYYTFTN